MIPAFTENGLLPLGEYDCTLPEIEERFVFNRKRRKLWDGCTRYISQLRDFPVVEGVCFGGSFLTDRKDPDDVDLAVAVEGMPTAKGSDAHVSGFV